jgi:integrase
MAWLEHPPSGVYKIVFRFGDRKYKRSLETSNPQLADTARLLLEENLRLVEQGRLDVPNGADLAEFLLYDGKLTVATPNGNDSQAHVSTAGLNGSTARNAVATLPHAATKCLGAILDEYFPKPPKKAFVPDTLRIARVHAGHLKRILGAKTPIGSLDAERLQDYVNRRQQCTGRRGKPLSATTIKKELGTLSSVWTKVKAKYALGEFPGTHLEYLRTANLPRFQTRHQIDRQIALGDLSGAQQAELWDALFLTTDEVAEVLSEISSYRGAEFLHPMVVMAAHTGARRSELCRSIVPDFDFDAASVVIHEKKRVKRQDTWRSVPLSPTLRSVIGEWLKTKRRCSHTFPREFKVRRSRKPREIEDAVSVDEASHHLARALAKSKWRVIRGWHIFRHSFASNAAAAGINQRLISAWLGHTTKAMEDRYRHLIPSHEKEAIGRVFN